MKHAVRLLFVLSVAATAILSPVARAQSTDLPLNTLGAVPTNQIRTQFFPGAPTWAPLYAYWDEQGWGYLLVEDQGYAWYTNNPIFRVSLYQNGRRYTGSGIRYGGQLFFGIQGHFFQGSVPGWGSYHPEGYPHIQRRFYLNSMP
jgi:hypothetical protein